MRRRIVLLEDLAHVQKGHFPNSAAVLANALGQLGCDVTLLTARGWAGGVVDDPQFRVERLSGVAAALWKIADEMVKRARRLPTRMRNVVGMGASVVRECGLVIGMRTHAVDAELISSPYEVRPSFVAAFGGMGRIVHYSLHLPPGGDAPVTFGGRVLDAYARARQRARLRAGGAMRLAVASDELCAAWRVRAPYLDPVVIPHAVSRDEEPVTDAREQLGVPADARVALVFGAMHHEKDPGTVWRAFRELPDWTLLVVGTMAESYRNWNESHDGAGAIVISGYVDEATRALAFSAADLVVLSFRDGFVRDSGVLRDALTWGRLVVCSSGNESAAAVERFGLGEVFVAEDPAALIEAVRRVASTLDPAALAAARAELSDVAVARAYLDVFDEMAATAGQTGRK